MKLSNLGIIHGISDMDKRYIRTTNIINLIYIFIISLPLIVFTIFLTEEGFVGYSRYILLIVVSSINILLNTYHKYVISKIFTLALPLLCTTIYPIALGETIPAGLFLWLPYGTMILGTITFLLFSIEKEKKVMFLMIAFFLVMIFCLDEVLMNIAEKETDISFIKNNYLFYIISKIVLTLLLYTAFFIFKFIYHKNRIELNNLSQQLNKKNAELRLLNSSLEAQIEERTQKLKIQNSRIRNLAFTNAHQVRARIARVIGLMEVSTYEVSSHEREFFALKIKENLNELDNLTKSISKELIEEIY